MTYTTSTIAELPKGEFFRRLRNGQPFGPTLTRENYDRTEGKYECQNQDDISDCRYLKGNLTVAIGETY